MMTMKQLIIIFILFACDKVDEPNVNIPSTVKRAEREIDQTAYAVGTKYARAISELGMDKEANKYFIQGIQDYFDNRIDFSEEEINMYALRVDDIIAYRRAENAKDEKSKGEQFIETLIKRDEKFLKSESGLVYKVYKKGQLNTPTDKTFVKMSYQSFHLDGKHFEGTPKGEPREIPYRGLLKAWQEAFNLAGIGGSIIIYAPPSLTYGNAGSAPYIKPGEYLKFQLKFFGASEKD